MITCSPGSTWGAPISGSGADDPVAADGHRGGEDASREDSSHHLAVETLVGRLERVRERIAVAGGDPRAVKVVAVTKGFPPVVVHRAVQAGILDLGENYAVEMAAKAAAFAPPGEGSTAAAAAQLHPRWHFLGAVQRRKVKLLAPYVSWWQSIARVAEGEEIAALGLAATVLVQVNVSQVSGRRGVAPSQVPAVVEKLLALGHDVRGLMMVGLPGSTDAVRAQFRQLASIGARLRLPELSMGMTEDLEIAVQEGSTMVRIGRGLFGKRTPACTRAQ